jgi:heparan-alpha-glucosaminide N-acetyltransferase
MSETDAKTLPPRLTSVDAYRGFVMFLMMAEVLHLANLSKAVPESDVWALLARHQQHVEWLGCTLHDLIQPSFSFLVGVALPFSIASRIARGQSKKVMTAHAFWRAFVLVALGIFLRSTGNSNQTNFTFEDTLSQIGLGYGFLFLLGLRPARDQWLALALILVGYWAAFAWYSPGDGFDSSKYGVPASWPHHLHGFAAHWEKNANLAWAFDRWFLNLFPRRTPFQYNGGGYATLSFIPTLGTMILGLLAGEVFRSDRSTGRKVLWLIVAGGVSLASGWALGEYGVCPVVKRIWTPSWVLFSGGWCFLLMAAWYLALDVIGPRQWAFPLVVIGMNSIAAYCLSHLIEAFIVKSLKTHLGAELFRAFGPAYQSTVQGAAVLLVLWLILFWMYRRRIFLRV